MFPEFPLPHAVQWRRQCRWSLEGRTTLPAFCYILEPWTLTSHAHFRGMSPRISSSRENSLYRSSSPSSTISRKAIMASSSLGMAKKSLGDLRLPVSVYSILVNTKISATLLTQHFFSWKIISHVLFTDTFGLLHILRCTRASCERKNRKN